MAHRFGKPDTHAEHIRMQAQVGGYAEQRKAEAHLAVACGAATAWTVHERGQGDAQAG